MLENTEKKLKIVKKNIGKRFLFNGTCVTSLMVALSLSGGNIINKASNSENNDVGCDSSYGIYSVNYIKELENMDYSKFDEKFINIYDNGQYILKNQKYNIGEIYILRLENGDVHLIQAGNNNEDILTHEKFEGKNNSLLCFRDSSIFYDLYLNGIVLETTDLDNVKDFIKKWDGTRHLQVPKNKADYEASKKI